MSQQGEVLFEFVRVGNAVKVSAIDVATATEVSVVGPANTPQAHLKMLALRKLRTMMDKAK